MLSVPFISIAEDSVGMSGNMNMEKPSPVSQGQPSMPMQSPQGGMAMESGQPEQRPMIMAPKGIMKTATMAQHQEIHRQCMQTKDYHWQHMQAIEQHLVNIEALAKQLVELQKAK
jgi:hypothetical protein